MKNLKLNVLASESLSEVEMNRIAGGTCCGCACAYASNGGSSTEDNAHANSNSGKNSPKEQERKMIVCDGIIVYG